MDAVSKRVGLLGRVLAFFWMEDGSVGGTFVVTGDHCGSASLGAALLLHNPLCEIDVAWEVPTLSLLF